MNIAEQPNDEGEQPIEPRKGDLPDPTIPVLYNPVIQKMLQRKKEISEELRSRFISPDDL